MGIAQLKQEWIGTEYDLLRHNCCVFSNILCEKLGVGSIPSWVTNLAAAGATVGDGMLVVKDKAQRTAIMAAAKAGKVDAKYNIKGTAQAKAQEFMTSMNLWMANS